MNPKSRTLLRVTLPLAAAVVESITTEGASGQKEDLVCKSDQIDPRRAVDDLVDSLMGKNAEARFNFIQANALNVADLDI